MADLRYDVEIDLAVKGSGGLGGLSGIGSGLDKLGGAFTKFGGRVAEAFTGAVEQAGSFAMSMAKVGVGAGLAGAAYGVLKLNNNLETTQTSIAAVLNAQGEVGNIGAGMDKAGTLVAKMREDAKQLPGEFEELVQIFQSGISSAGNAGLNSIQFEKMSAQAMAAGKAMSVPLDQAGRELAQLLEGRAGAHNVFGTRLGITATDGFNKSSKEDQVKRITEALAKYDPAIKQFGTTFDAISSATVDNIKAFGMTATGPLFEHVKATLTDINNWFDNNKGQVSQWANQLGRWLAEAFDKGKAVVMDWWPAISAFAENAYNRITAIWADVGPTVSKIGESIQGFLKDPGSIDKIIKVLELYAMVKVGGGAMDLLGGLGGGGGGAAGAMGGMGGGALGALLGGAGTVALTVGAVTIAAQVAQLLGGNSGKEYDMFEGNDWWSTVGNLFVRKAQYAVDQDNDTASTHARLIATYGQMDMASQAYQARIEGLIASGDELGASMLGAAAAANSAAGALAKLGGSGVPPPTEPGGEAYGTSALNYIGNMAASGVAAKIAGDAAAKAADKKKGGGGGGGGAQKVEITINSNQAPGQIAREVVLEVQRSLADKRRNPGSSVSVRNFSAIRGG